MKKLFAHAELWTHDSLTPGHIYRGLLDFLKRYRGQDKPTGNHQELRNLPNHAYLYCYGQNTTGGPLCFNSPESCVDAMRSNKVTTSRLLFLTGYSTPRWITLVAAACKTDPEFLNSYLDFLCRNSWYSYPSLPSSYSNIVRLRVCTIGSRDVRRRNASAEFMAKSRRRSAEAMSAYRDDLKIGKDMECGDSIIREHHSLDERFSVIEQEIAVCMHFENRRWTGKTFLF